jgi:hypothetical protein
MNEKVEATRPGRSMAYVCELCSAATSSIKTRVRLVLYGLQQEAAGRKSSSVKEVADTRGSSIFGYISAFMPGESVVAAINDVQLKCSSCGELSRWKRVK